VATEESSTTMNVAIITETATSHGFTVGRHSLGEAPVACGVPLTIWSF